MNEHITTEAIGTSSKGVLVYDVDIYGRIFIHLSSFWISLEFDEIETPLGRKPTDGIDPIRWTYVTVDVNGCGVWTSSVGGRRLGGLSLGQNYSVVNGDFTVELPPNFFDIYRN